jgi:hypothetical protein
MESRRRKSVRAHLAVAVAGLCAVALACAPQTGGGGPPRSTTTTTTTSTIPWSEPVGLWTYFDLTCSVNVYGTYYTFPQTASVNVEAPYVVSQGETFDMMVAPGPFIVPTNVQGYSLVDLRAFQIRFPMSPNMTLVDSVMSAGNNMGPGYPSFSLQGDFLVYTVPGPFVPGSEVQLPKVRLTVTATGPSGSTIETRMDRLTNVANFGVTTVGSGCYPNDPDPLFWSTAIL